MTAGARPFGMSVHDVHLTEEYFAACRAAGLYSVEVSCSPEKYETLDWAALAALAKRHGLVLNSVHLPFSGRISIAHPDPVLRAQAMERDRAVLRGAASAGIRIAVIHPSSEPISDEERETVLGYAQSNLHALAELAAELEMTAAVENLPRTCLGRNSAEMMRLLAADDRLRVCFDTNHLLSEPIADFVRALGAKIVTLHVSDYDFVDERHGMPGEGDVDWREFMALLDEIGYRGVFNYELALGAETRMTLREREVTPADCRANYDSLLRCGKPVTVGGTRKR